MDTVAAIAILVVGSGFHFCGQALSVLNWQLAQRLGLQESHLAPGYHEYEFGTAMADALVGWVYGVAALGLFLGTSWGSRLAAIPGAILMYHGLVAWFTESARRQAGHGVFTDRFRIVWCSANLGTGALALWVAWGG